MTEKNLDEAELLFWAFGHAVYAAQTLERGIKLLLRVIDSEREKSGLPKFFADIDDPKIKKSLGSIFSDALKVEYITEKEKKMIWEAVRTRNILAHSYWGEKQILASLKPKGREWLVGDLFECKAKCQKADKIIESLINQYLAQYGVTVESLSTPIFEEHWENREPPENVLQ